MRRERNGTDPSDIAESMTANWNRLIVELDIDTPRARRLGDELLRAYGEPQRRYHNQAHLAHFLGVLDRFADAGEPTAPQRLAAWFHDAIHDPQRGDNEERSAQWAEATLGSLGVDPLTISDTARLVRATTDHRLVDVHGCALFLDGDLSSLGVDALTFAQDSAAIRREYAHVPDPEYSRQRVAILEGFQARRHIFHTPQVRKALESQARANIAREITRLSTRSL